MRRSHVGIEFFNIFFLLVIIIELYGIRKSNSSARVPLALETEIETEICLLVYYLKFEIFSTFARGKCLDSEKVRSSCNTSVTCLLTENAKLIISLITL